MPESRRKVGDLRRRQTGYLKSKPVDLRRNSRVELAFSDPSAESTQVETVATSKSRRIMSRAVTRPVPVAVSVGRCARPNSLQRLASRTAVRLVNGEPMGEPRGGDAAETSFMSRLFKAQDDSQSLGLTVLPSIRECY